VTLDDEATDSPRAEWYAIAMIVGVVAYLRVRVGRDAIGIMATTGLLALVITLVRSALYRRLATYGAGRHGETLARVTRQLTVPLLLAFPAAVATGEGAWRNAFAGPSRNADLWIGAMAYLLALLELTQLRVWALNTTLPPELDRRERSA
jgi:presenilin-like A22 family membrane protease